MSILYLTWGEVIANNGIFDNQVLEQLKLIKQVDATIGMRVISGIPIVNGVLLKNRRTYNKEIRRIKEEFALSNIEFAPRWILTVAKWFHSKPFQLSFYSLGQYQFLRNFVTRNDIKVVHCRGYHATRIAILVRNQYNLNYKVVFDTRGLFPEEGVMVGHHSKASLSYKTWKSLESQMLDAADAVINVSETFTEYIKTLTDNPHIYTVHTSTNLDIFKANPEHKKNAREKLRIEDNQKVLVYLGSIDVSRGWHTVSNLVSIFHSFRQIFLDAKLLLITRSSHEMLENEFDKGGVDKTNYILVAANSPSETNSYLQAADYATLPYRDIGNEIEELIGYTMIASKTGEYFAMGLPLLVNQSVGAASKMVKDNGIGCVYETGKESLIGDQLRQLDDQYDLVSKRCIEIAQNYFGAKGNAKKYIEVYRKLLLLPISIAS